LYAAHLQMLPKGTKGSLPVFDYMLLGVGKDGHIGSLYPEGKDLYVDEWVVAVDRVRTVLCAVCCVVYTVYCTLYYILHTLLLYCLIHPYTNPPPFCHTHPRNLPPPYPSPCR
jgi:hypothetical protein